jgi:hypothetical protein
MTAKLTHSGQFHLDPCQHRDLILAGLRHGRCASRQPAISVNNEDLPKNRHFPGCPRSQISHVCDLVALGRVGRVEHHFFVHRLRALAAVLGCLAVLAGGFMTVAASAASSPLPSEKGAIGGQPCSHCEDCGSTPCPAPTAACVQACMSVAPSLVAVAFRLPAMAAGHAPRSLRTIVLSGLSPPPDPFPPRA